MEPIRISATELRLRARELIERVHYYRECYQVETFGRPMAVIISCEDFQAIQLFLEQHAQALAPPPVIANKPVARADGARRQPMRKSGARVQ